MEPSFLLMLSTTGLSTRRRLGLGAARHYTAVLGITVLFAGCSNSNQGLAPVHGTVKYQGRFLDHGQVVLLPTGTTKGAPAVGEIQQDGSFTLKTGSSEGAAVGSHVVTVHYRRELTAAEIKNRALIVPESLIPSKYWNADESSLRFEVQQGEENVLQLDLK